MPCNVFLRTRVYVCMYVREGKRKKKRGTGRNEGGNKEEGETR